MTDQEHEKILEMAQALLACVQEAVGADLSTGVAILGSIFAHQVLQIESAFLAKIETDHPSRTMTRQ